MLFVLGIVVGILLSGIMVVVSIELDKRRISPISTIKDALPKRDAEKGELIKPEDDDLERFLDSLTKNDV